MIIDTIDLPGTLASAQEAGLTATHLEGYHPTGHASVAAVQVEGPGLNDWLLREGYELL